MSALTFLISVISLIARCPETSADSTLQKHYGAGREEVRDARENGSGICGPREGL